MKFSPEGDSIWSRQDTSDVLPVSNFNEHVLGGVGVLSSGSIVAGGYVTKTEGQNQSSYIWLIKVSNDGCLDTLYCGLVSGVEEGERLSTDYGINMYPNPARGYLNLSYHASNTKNANLQITNLLGAKVKDFKLDVLVELHQIPLVGLPNGQYFYSILEDGQRVFSGKFVKME